MVTGPKAVKVCCPKDVATGPSDGDGGPASDGPQDLRVPSPKYQCVQCSENYFKSDIYINLDDPSMDWQGSLNLICRQCWNANNKGDKSQQWTESNWRKSCKQQWLKRQMMTEEHFKLRVRTVAWKDALKDIGEQYEGESRKDYRERLIRKSSRLAVSITAGIMKLKPEQKIAVHKVMDHWVDEWSKKVDNPDYIPAMDCEETTTTHLMEFVDKVLPGLDEYYICRQKICSMVCLSTHWVHNNPNGQFRCPACGEQYRPWKEQPGYWKTNKVFVTYDDVGLQAGRAELAAGSSDGLAHKNQVMVFPVIWPDTATQVMMDRINGIFLDIDRDLLAVPPKDRLGYVLENLSVTAPHKAFQLYQFLPATKAIIDGLNAVQSEKKVSWQYDHIEKAGYMGIKLGPEHDLDEPMAQVDFLRLWGLSMWLTHKAIDGIPVSLT